METFLKISAIFFDVIFVVLVVYLLFVFGIRIYWHFKSKRLKDSPLPLEGELLKLKKGKGAVYFYSPTCKPCKVVEPVIRKLTKELKGVKFVRVDVSKNPELARKLGILATPSILITRDGTIKEVILGPVSERILREKLSG